MKRLTPGSCGAGYHGILRESGAPRWTCSHFHDTTAEARQCATEERDRREAEAAKAEPS